MLSRLVALCLSQRLLVLVATLLLIGAGVTAWNGLPIDAFPDVSTTQVKLIIKAPGMTPEEVESRITVPITLPWSSYSVTRTTTTQLPANVPEAGLTVCCQRRTPSGVYEVTARLRAKAGPDTTATLPAASAAMLLA